MDLDSCTTVGIEIWKDPDGRKELVHVGNFLDNGLVGTLGRNGAGISALASSRTIRYKPEKFVKLDDENNREIIELKRIPLTVKFPKEIALLVTCVELVGYGFQLELKNLHVPFDDLQSGFRTGRDSPIVLDPPFYGISGKLTIGDHLAFKQPHYAKLNEIIQKSLEQVYKQVTGRKYMRHG